MDGTDATRRPSLTTRNRIIAKLIDDAVFVPLESLHNHADSVTYVYKRNGNKASKQEVMIGDANNNDVVIVTGLADKDEVYLSVPPGLEDANISLLKEMDGKRRKKTDEIKPAPAAATPTARLSN
jgi:hypothetical protein